MSDQLTSTRLMAMQVVITREEGEFLGLGILAEDNVRGVRVHHIVAGSPAAKAKLTSHTRGDAGPAIGTGDVLLEINGQPCLDASYDDVVTTLHEQRMKPVELVVCKGGALDQVAGEGPTSIVRTPQRNGAVKLTVVPSNVAASLTFDSGSEDGNDDGANGQLGRGAGGFHDAAQDGRTADGPAEPSVVVGHQQSPSSPNGAGAAGPGHPSAATVQSEQDRRRSATPHESSSVPTSPTVWGYRQHAPTVITADDDDDDEAALGGDSRAPRRADSDEGLPPPEGWSLTALGVAIAAAALLRWCRFCR